MKSRFLYTSKLILYVLYFVVLITLINNIKHLHRNTWRFMPNEVYEDDIYKILLWTSPKNVPFSHMGNGQSGFILRQCPYTNCIVITNKSIVGDYRWFDVIAFHGPEIDNLKDKDLPKKRFPHQKYVFASIEASHNYPVCSETFDEYFNWTWTYRLASEVRWGYIVIRNFNGDIIGPSKNITWLEVTKMRDVGKDLKEELNNKTKAVAWFASNCDTASQRESYITILQSYLIEQYKLKIDIYGDCGSLKCPREQEQDCYKRIGKQYYFYLSFENAFGEDYVTEKLLIPLQNNMVPIVFGGANYNNKHSSIKERVVRNWVIFAHQNDRDDLYRDIKILDVIMSGKVMLQRAKYGSYYTCLSSAAYLPPGSYLNARELGPFELGDMINVLIGNSDKYAEYFRWKSYYSYHKTTDSVETNEYCKMCALLNNAGMRQKTSVYKHFRKWWNPPDVSC